jgi:hypothetical protein
MVCELDDTHIPVHTTAARTVHPHDFSDTHAQEPTYKTHKSAQKGNKSSIVQTRIVCGGEGRAARTRRSRLTTEETLGEVHPAS